MSKTLPQQAMRLFDTVRRHRWLVAGVAVAVVLGMAVGAVAMRLAQAPPAHDPEIAPRIAVRAVAVARLDIVQTATISGALTPVVSLNLNSKASGVVARVPVVMGQLVAAGDVLLELSGSDLLPQVKAAQAALEAARHNLLRLERGTPWEDLQLAQANLMQAQAAWDAAVLGFERMSFLYREGAISRQQFESVQTQVIAATSQLTMAQMQLRKAEQGADQDTIQAVRAQVRQAEAGYEAAKARLEDTILRAPVSGQISYVNISPGELIAPGMAQIGLVDTTNLFLEAAVTEGVVAYLEAGQSIPVLIAAAGVERQGLVEQVSPAADPRTRLFGVRVRLDNEDRLLRAGMTAEAVVETTRALGVLGVPREALVAVGQDYHVFVVEDSTAVRRPVVPGVLGPTHAEITAGLTEGEVVVTTGAGLLRDGSRVNLVGGGTP